MKALILVAHADDPAAIQLHLDLWLVFDTLHELPTADTGKNR
jgi:hypothetical protein